MTEAFDLSEKEFQTKYKVKKPAQNDTDIVMSCLAGSRSLEAIESLHTAGYYL